MPSPSASCIVLLSLCCPDLVFWVGVDVDAAFDDFVVILMVVFDLVVGECAANCISLSVSEFEPVMEETSGELTVLVCVVDDEAGEELLTDVLGVEF